MYFIIDLFLLFVYIRQFMYRVVQVYHMFKELCANAVKKTFHDDTQLWYKSPFIIIYIFRSTNLAATSKCVHGEAEVSKQ